MLISSNIFRKGGGRKEERGGEGGEGKGEGGEEEGEGGGKEENLNLRRAESRAFRRQRTRRHFEA